MLKRQAKKISLIFLSVLFFTLGFGVHAFFFPYLLPETLINDKAKAVDRSMAPVSDSESKAFTLVRYSNGDFNPRVVQMTRSYYLGIVNTSTNELMWLTSDNPLFRTPRGYALSEQLRTIVYEPGTYTVSSTLHPDKKLQIIVK